MNKKGIIKFMIMSFLKIFLRILMIFGVVFAVGIGIFIVQIYSEIRNDTDKIVNYKPPIATQIFDRQERLVANILMKNLDFIQLLKRFHHV